MAVTSASHLLSSAAHTCRANMQRRLSEIITSPWRIMNEIATKTADYIIPDDPEPSEENPAKEAPAVVAPKPAAAKKQPAVPKPAAAKPKKRPAPSTSPARKSPARKVVKTEPMRELPFRSSGRRHKAGFYNEAHLTEVAWRGTGSSVDPIRFLE